MFFFYDPTYILIIISIIISIYASAKVNSAYHKYSQEYAQCGMPAHVVTRQILDANGMSDVRIERVHGNLTDHYDPRTKVIRLSDTVYDSNSIAALGVAIHETGHAMQDNEDYLPLRLRSTIAPVAQFGSYASWFLILLGLLFSSFSWINIGIWAFVAVVFFQLVTLPVEFNASSRALVALEGGGYLTREETPKAKKVLSAAAMTYVAAALTAVLQLLRLLILFGGRRE